MNSIRHAVNILDNPSGPSNTVWCAGNLHQHNQWQTLFAGKHIQQKEKGKHSSHPFLNSLKQFFPYVIQEGGVPHYKVSHHS